MQRTIRAADLTWQEFATIRDGAPIILVPCGSLEQHGPHLPLGVDALLSDAVAVEVAMTLDGLVMPALHYGYKSMPKTGGGSRFPGTTNLDGKIYIDIVANLVRELARQGLTKICFLDGHLENQWFLTEGIDVGVREISGGAIKVVRMEYWDGVDEDTLSRVFPEGLPDFAYEHAAVMETSLMMHFFPDCVRTDRIPDEPPYPFPPYDVFPPDPSWGPVGGALRPTAGASPERGRLLAKAAISGVARALVDVFGHAA